MKAFLFNKKNIILDCSTTDLIGGNINDVIEKLNETGFNNYKAIPIKDIYIGVHKYTGEVEQVVINGQSFVDEGTMIPYDADIIITYHIKKQFMFPYSSNQMIKMNYNVLAQELSEIGFTEIYTFPLQDLKTGWIKKKIQFSRC